MKNLKYLILFLFILMNISGLVLGQKKNTKPVKNNTKPTVKTSPQSSPQTVQPTPTPTAAVQDDVEPDKTPVKKNERPTGTTDLKKINENIKNNTSANSNNPAYFYEFTQPNFLVAKVLIEHDDQGKGKITFLKKESDEEISDPIQLTPEAMERINKAYDALNFLDSSESYQYEKDYSHLGNMTFTLKKGGRERTTKFNWTENKDARALSDEYRKIGQQYVWMFEINLSRENQPLDSPRLMDLLDSYIRRNEVSNPVQMIPFLKELSNDERIPLIARNHATRLITVIEKNHKKAEK